MLFLMHQLILVELSTMRICKGFGVANLNSHYDKWKLSIHLFFFEETCAFII